MKSKILKTARDYKLKIKNKNEKSWGNKDMAIGLKKEKLWQETDQNQIVQKSNCYETNPVNIVELNLPDGQREP